MEALAVVAVCCGFCFFAFSIFGVGASLLWLHVQGKKNTEETPQAKKTVTKKTKKVKKTVKTSPKHSDCGSGSSSEPSSIINHNHIHVEPTLNSQPSLATKPGQQHIVEMPFNRSVFVEADEVPDHVHPHDHTHADEKKYDDDLKKKVDLLTKELAAMKRKYMAEGKKYEPTTMICGSSNSPFGCVLPNPVVPKKEETPVKEEKKEDDLELRKTMAAQLADLKKRLDAMTEKNDAPIVLNEVTLVDDSMAKKEESPQKDAAPVVPMDPLPQIDAPVEPMPVNPIPIDLLPKPDVPKPTARSAIRYTKND